MIHPQNILKPWNKQELSLRERIYLQMQFVLASDR